MLNDLISQIRLTYRLLRDERVSINTKLIPALVLIYVVSPLDLIPFFPIDDLAIILAGMKLFEYMVPDPIVAEHRAALGMERVTAE